MLEFFRNLFQSGDFMPHGHCYFWQAEILWTHVAGDMLTALSYFTIPVSLVYFAVRKKSPRFNRLLLLFGAFILLCGATHIISIYTVWVPAYRLEGMFKVLTGLVSFATAIYLVMLIPTALKIPSPAQLQEANQGMAAFSYSVAHDLRAPMRHIQGFASLLIRSTEGRLTGQEQAFLKNITGIATETGVRIDELLKYTRSEKQELTLQAVNMDQLVRHIVQEYNIEYTDRNISWEIGSLPGCVADPAMIETVLRNLIDNAVKYSAKTPNPHIVISGKPLKKHIQYTVSDNGAGFDMQFSQKLFQPFERLHLDSEFEGYGIGLAYSSRIMHRHGGSIKGQGTPGKGATFSIHIPHQHPINTPVYEK